MPELKLTLPQPWAELERVGERMIAAQKADADALKAYNSKQTHELYARWRVARGEVYKLMEERNKLAAKIAS